MQIDANTYRGLVVIIPTRNRANLAAKAISSILNQPECDDVHILVSDNSTEDNDIKVASHFCEQKKDKRLRYIKTPKPLSMASHWNWATTKALELYDANHFLILTDRSLFKKNDLTLLKCKASQYPEEVISYNWDVIFDHKKPISLLENIWSGRLFKISSLRLLTLSSQCVIHPSLPRMMTSIVPRFVLEKLRNTWGSYFDSIAPDYNFAYRCLAILDSILYFDKAPILMYGIDQSNGSAFFRGLATKTTNDFTTSNIQSNHLFYLSPVPEFRTCSNAIIHEYNFVRKESKNSNFTEVNWNKYLDVIASDISYFEDDQLKAEMTTLLKSHGWKESPTPITVLIHRIASNIRKKLNLNLRGKIKKVVLLLKDQDDILFSPAKSTKPLFDSLEEAIEYMNRSLEQKNTDKDRLNHLIESLGPIID